MTEKKEYRFTVIIEPCEEGGYFAMCPAFPGCHVEGETYEETLEEMRAAIDAFLEDYIEEGEPIPEDDVTITTLKVAV
jgi:antitoxin HicB